MVVNRRQLKRQRKGRFELLKQPAHVGLNLVEAVDFLVVGHEHIAVHLVNENFVDNVLFQLARLLNQVPQTHARVLIVLLLGINDIDEGAAALDLEVLVVLEGVVAWEVDHVELNVFIVGHLRALDDSCGQ